MQFNGFCLHGNNSNEISNQPFLKRTLFCRFLLTLLNISRENRKKCMFSANMHFFLIFRKELISFQETWTDVIYVISKGWLTRKLTKYLVVSSTNRWVDFQIFMRWWQFEISRQNQLVRCPQRFAGNWGRKKFVKLLWHAYIHAMSARALWLLLDTFVQKVFNTYNSQFYVPTGMYTFKK